MDRWEYLYRRPFSVRHAIAEHFMAGLPEVVDVGTYKRELEVGGRLWSVDPLDTVGGFVGSVAEFWAQFKPSGPYGVVCLGFALEGGQAEADAMVELCEGAERVVLEWPTEWEQPVISPSFCVNSRKLLVQMSIDMSDPGAPGFEPYTLRTLQVWE